MIEVSPQTRTLLALSMLKGVGPAALRKVVQVPQFEEMSLEELRFHLPRNAGASIGSVASSEAMDEANKQLNLSLNAGIRIISATDPEHPGADP